MKNYLVLFNCTRLVFRIYSQVILFTLLLWPVLLSYLLYPDTFVFSWNEGRGGFLIATVLLLVEILGSRPVIRGPKTGLLIALGILISLYFLSLPFGSSNFLSSIGSSAGV